MNCSDGYNNNQIGGKFIRSFSSEKYNKENISENINEYISDDDKNNLNILIGSYNVDIFEYLITGIKKYSNIGVLNVELQPRFSYYDLDILKDTSVKKILKKDDRDELYQLYEEVFDKKKDNIVEFYKWLKENKCYLLEYYVTKIDRLLSNNPFKNDYYILDSSTYLYNRNYIKTYPLNASIKSNIKRNILKENKNDYRLRRDN
jgi:adenylate kinase family enzyme